MKTNLLEKIVEFAEKKRKEKEGDFLALEYIYWAMLKVSEDKSLLQDTEIDEKEYDELLEATQNAADRKAVEEVIDRKQFDEEDETGARNFKRWMLVSSRTAPAAFRRLQSELSDAFGKAEEDAAPMPRKAEVKREQQAEKKAEQGTEAKAEKKAEPEKEAVSLMSLVSDTAKLRRSLLETVIGQDVVIKKFVEGYFRGEMLANADTLRKGPRSVFLFAGGPGVGKTLLAETVAKAIELPYKRFDMSGYAASAAGDELTGISSFYKNAKEGVLTKFVKENPHCILVFDEIEKAALSVIQLFLQILDAGHLFDNYLEENISFADVVVIFTTNAGKQLYSNTEVRNLSLLPKNIILDALKKDINPLTGMPFFPEAICSRLGTGTVLMFQHLSATNLIKITERELHRNLKNVETAYGISFEGMEDIPATILYTMGGKSDARNATSQARNFLYRELFELLRLAENKNGIDCLEGIKKVSWQMNLDHAPEEIRQLYKDQGDACILVYGDKNLERLSEMQLREGKVETASSLDEVASMIHKKDISLALVDYCYGGETGTSGCLNVEDINSLGKKAFQMIKKDCPDIPLYVLETEKYRYSDEEVLSLSERGMESVVSLPLEDGKETEKIFSSLCEAVCHQRALDMLTLRHQILACETSQRISGDGHTGEIELFDFKLSQAVETEDQKSVLSAETKPDKHWEDVIVADDVKEELQYFIGYLKNPKKAMAKGARAPKGLLMYGPPGTGKTSLAKVVATESDVTFLEIGADQFLSKWVGEGPERVHQMFATARKYAPAILFIDEIDAIGKTRSERSGTDSTHEILNALLTEMDGFKKTVNKPVLVMAATNLGGNNGNTRGLDPALVRRFDRAINISLPNKEGREKLFQMFRERNEMLQISDEEIKSLALRSIGMSPANIESAIETAIRDAIRSDSVVNDAIMDEAFEKFNSGEEKKWDESELLRTARHEAGHAFICSYFGEKPSYLTIVARDNHGGYMMHGDMEGKGVYTKEDLLHRICVSLGGRAAEIVYYGEKDGITTGPSSDLEHATRIARSMVCDYGMYEDAGLGTLSDNISAEESSMISSYVNKILFEELERAREIISGNEDKINRLVEELMDKMHLTEGQIQKVLLG